MALTWYEKGPVGGTGIAKAGGTGPPANTYYYVIVPYVTTDANISPDFAFYWYRPQYYGKRCAELSIAVNGAEEVQLSWNKVAGCDGYIIMRTATSGNYNYSTRDRIWNAGDVAAFTDNNQASTASYKMNIPERAHGCCVITSAYALRQILDDLFNVQGEDSALMGLGSAEFADDTITNGADYWGVAVCQFFIIHIHSGGWIYPGFYASTLEQQLWYMFSQIYINNGGTLSFGSTDKSATYHGPCLFLHNPCSMQNQIYGVPGGTMDAFGMIFSQFPSGGSSGYIDAYINCDWDAGAIIMSNCRTIGFSDGDADLIIDGCDYFESYYQLGIRAPAGSGTINVERYRAHEAGAYIFLRGAYTYTLKDLDYSDWRAHAVATDVWFYNPGSDPFTGAVVLVNPSWKDKSSSIPVIVVTNGTGQHTGTCTVKFELDLKVVDVDGNPIVGASVRVYDKDGNLLDSDTTGADGTITTMEVIHAVYSVDGSGNLVEGYKFPHQLLIEASGYRQVEYDITIDKPLDMTLPMRLTGGGPPGAVVEVTDTTATVTCPSTTAVVEVKEP